MSTVIALADIDDSLIQTTRKCPDGGIAIAFDRQGQACGFLTPAQDVFLQWLRATAQIVPVTARSSSGLSRVHIPFDSYAICSFGGVILSPNGQVEPRWHALMFSQAAASQPVLQRLLRLVEQESQQRNIDVRSCIVTDQGLNLYLSVKHNHRNVLELNQLKTVLEPSLPADWQLHSNGNFLAVMPPYLGKQKAVSWYLDNLAPPDCLTMGIGDSLTDLPFMQLCDIMLTPSKSQLSRRLNREAV